jgi:hypothetical protein
MSINLRPAMTVLLLLLSVVSLLANLHPPLLICREGDVLPQALHLSPYLQAIAYYVTAAVAVAAAKCASNSPLLI